MNIIYQNSEINDILVNTELPKINGDKKIKNDLLKKNIRLIDIN